MRHRPHYSKRIWKRSFISTVRPTVHTNPSRKPSFSTLLFKPKEFENAVSMYYSVDGKQSFYVTSLPEFSSSIYPKWTRQWLLLFKVTTITAEIHACSLANFYGQNADRHMNLKFVRRVSEREREIRQFVIVKNKLMLVFNASVLLLTMNFVITLPK